MNKYKKMFSYIYNQGSASQNHKDTSWYSWVTIIKNKYKNCRQGCVNSMAWGPWGPVKLTSVRVCGQMCAALCWDLLPLASLSEVFPCNQRPGLPQVSGVSIAPSTAMFLPWGGPAGYWNLLLREPSYISPPFTWGVGVWSQQQENWSI